MTKRVDEEERAYFASRQGDGAFTHFTAPGEPLPETNLDKLIAEAEAREAEAREAEAREAVAAEQLELPGLPVEAPKQPNGLTESEELEMLRGLGYDI